MKRFLFLLIGLFFGTGLGFMLAMQVDAPIATHDHGAQAHPSTDAVPATEGHGHHNMPAHADSWAKRPSLQARVARDPVSGWNLEIVTENFAFAPGAAGLASIPGEGHAHVYLNGEKIARVYGNWYHIASAPSGDILLRVSLNDNAHHPLYLDGEPIEVVLALPTD